MDNFPKIPCSFKKLADITLKTEDGYTFKFYKILLAQTSKYFETLFCSNFNQSVHILDSVIKGKVLHLILSYITHKEDVLTEENVSDILFTADYFAIEEFVNKCKIFIFNNGCTTNNCIQLYRTACVSDLRDVKAKCLRYIEIHTVDIFTDSKTGIIDLPFVAFNRIMECDNLNIPDESLVWDILISWIKDDCPNRLPHLPELLKYIRFQEMYETSLTDRNELKPSVKEINSFCYNLVKSNLCVNSAIEQMKKCPFSITSLPDSRSPNKIYFICKQIPQREAELYITYDERFDYWQLLGKLPKHFNLRTSHICFSGRFVHFSFYIFPTKMKSFDLLHQSWTPVSDVPQSLLTSYKVVSVNGDIYALGGVASSVWEAVEDGENNLSSDMLVGWNNNLDEILEEEEEEEANESVDEISIEEENGGNADMEEEEEDLYEPVNIIDIVQRYNRETDSWQLMSQMTPARIIEAVVLNDKIYVVGVSENYEDCQDMICQMYDPITDIWTSIPNPKFFRAFCAVVTFHEKLYIIGGNDGNYNIVKKIEEYNPTENVWRTLSNLPNEFYNPEAIVIQNKLIVFDKGKWNIWKENRLDENQCSVFWDIENDIWYDATFINKELMMEMRLCRIYPIENGDVLKELTLKHKRGKSIWTKSTLVDLELGELTTNT